MQLTPNTAYFVWFAYENHTDGHRGVPLDTPLRFQPGKPEGSTSENWVNIGMVTTDDEGCVPFFRRGGKSVEV